MDNKNLEIELDALTLRGAINMLILIELCKLGATRDQAREVLGSMSNETFAKVNQFFTSNKSKGKK